MRVDLKQIMSEFPSEIVVTNKGPDIVIWSAKTKQAVLLELTVQWEERTEEAYERKNLKYQELVKDCQQNGWKIWFFSVEVGCRGFVRQSMWRALRAIGITGAGGLCRETETASLWLWRRADKWKTSR